MDQSFKNKLGMVFALCAVVLVVSAGVHAFWYSQEVVQMNQRSFSVSADGKVTSAPDIAQFSASVITEGGADISALQKTNADKVNAMIDFITNSGVEKNDLKTVDYSISPRYSTCDYQLNKPCPPAQIIGYTINQSLQVKIRNFDKIGELMAGTTAKGANSISGLSFTIDDPDGFRQQAKELAIKKAMEKATLTAKASGVKLGKLLSIDESSSPTPYYAPVMESRGISAAKDATTPQIEPGSQEVTVSVTLRFEMK